MLNYYLFTSFRRKKLDSLFEQNKHYYRGVVLDIGGKDRGKFTKPKNNVTRWIFADIEQKNSPDIILDVANMNQIIDKSIDIVNAAELFEHVEKINQGLKECYRVLKKDGHLIISVPFLYQIHADPYDYQRWTIDKWKKELSDLGFQIELFKITGNFFSTLCDMHKKLIMQIPKPFKYLGYIFYPFMDLLIKLDDSRLIQNNPALNKYHNGYFIVAKKIN